VASIASPLIAVTALDVISVSENISAGVEGEEFVSVSDSVSVAESTIVTVVVTLLDIELTDAAVADVTLADALFAGASLSDAVVSNAALSDASRT
jgi:uncharacterized protein YjbI with pentapeptide repeats